MFNDIEKALEELRDGKVIIVCDDEDRENEGDFIALAEYATPEVINFMATHGRGLICVAIEEEIAERLDLKLMVENNTDRHGTAFTVSIDHESCSTGISAFERSHTILELLNEKSKPTDFRRPGHVFPLIAKKGGVLVREGHTEAAVDLARLAGSKGAGVICEIMNADGSMARVRELEVIAKKHNLSMITIQDLKEYKRLNEAIVTREADVTLPTDYGQF